MQRSSRPSLSSISRDKSQYSFQNNADRKPGGDIAHPVCKQYDAGCDQARADAPEKIALRGRKPTGRGSERADMDTAWPEGNASSLWPEGMPR
jgi:hypothetical protein